MIKQDFITLFVTTFLANYAVKHYEDCAARGNWDMLNHPPAEDVLELAEMAWKDYEVQKALTKHLR
jgi:hypothetical protein